VNISMRDAFLDELYNIASEDHNVILISADFGAPSLDRFKKDLSGQFINIGIAEQNMVSVAAGLALGGKRVFCYAILPFTTLRCFEQVKVDLCLMNLPVTLIGVGAGYAYDDSGPTHHGLEDLSVMSSLPNITILNASDSVMAGAFARIAYKNQGPTYVRLDRTCHQIYNKRDFTQGIIATVREADEDLIIVTTGYMVRQAQEIAHSLTNYGISVGIFDLYRIKPVNIEVLLQIISQSKRIVTIEEHFLRGGIGSIIAEIMADNEVHKPMKRFGVPGGYSFKYGGRELLHKECGLDVESITNGILKWK